VTSASQASAVTVAQQTTTTFKTLTTSAFQLTSDGTNLKAAGTGTGIVVATVKPKLGTAIPTGSVLFTLYSASGSPITQTVPLNNGQASLDLAGQFLTTSASFIPLPAGKYTKITAVYQPDPGALFAASPVATALTSSGATASLTAVGQATQLKAIQVLAGTIPVSITNPLKLTAGVALTVTVEALDAAGNLVSVYNGPLSVAATTTSGASLGATQLGASLSGGVATFPSIRLGLYPVGSTVALTLNVGTLSTELNLAINGGRLA
jgi:hypothetical protein